MRPSAPIAPWTPTVFRIDQYGYVQITGSYSGQGNAQITGLEMINSSTITQSDSTSLTVNGILASGGAAEVITGTTTPGSATIKAASGATLVIRTDLATDSLEIDSVIADSGGGLTKSGAGTLILTGANSYSGGTAISGGTLQLGLVGPIGTPGVLGTSGNLGSGGVLDNGTLAFDRSDSTTVSNVISGTGGVSEIGGGTTDLNSAETYTGATQVQNGTLQIGVGGSLSIGTDVTIGSGSTSGVLVLGDGTASLNLNIGSLASSGTGSGNAVVNNTTSTGTSVLTLNDAVSVTYGGVLGGSGSNQNNIALVMNGSGLQTLTGANTYTGGTTFANGTLNAGNALALGTSGNLTFTGGYLQYSAANTTDYSSRILNSTGAIAIDTNGQSVSYGSALSATNRDGLIKTGAGTLTLTAANNYNGYTYVNAGTLQVTSLAALGTAQPLGLSGNVILGNATAPTPNSTANTPTLKSRATGSGQIVFPRPLPWPPGTARPSTITIRAGVLVVTGSVFDCPAPPSTSPGASGATTGMNAGTHRHRQFRRV